jgi:hypothetical protein
MTISSRTPEGEPNCCPICGRRVRLEPSDPSWDGPCPQCGHLLWFSERETDLQQRLLDVQKRLLDTQWRAILDIVIARFGSLPIETEPNLKVEIERVGYDVMWNRVLKATNLQELLTER